MKCYVCGKSIIKDSISLVPIDPKGKNRRWSCLEHVPQDFKINSGVKELCVIFDKQFEGINEEAHEPQAIFEPVETKKDNRTLDDFTSMDKDKLIFELWKIIDNIDTFGDMAKSNDQAFRNLTEKEQQKRWEFVDSHYIDLIYDKYYEKCCKNGK